MEEFMKVFEGLDTVESYFILFVSVVSFLFGFLVAYLLRSSKIRRLNKHLKAKQKELDDASVSLATISEQMELKDADLKRANFEIEELRAKVARLEEEKTSLYNEVLEASAEQDKVKVSIQNYLSTIESLNEQIVDLREQNDALATGVNTQPIVTTDSKELSKLQSDYSAQKGRMEAVERRLNDLADENHSLKVMLEEIRDNSPTQTVGSEATKVEEIIEEPVLKTGSDKSSVKNKIITDDQEKDDLSLINGVGPFLEKKLNEAGIFTYEQISNWDKPEIDRVTEEIAFFPGRIERDDWVGQAIDLLKMKVVSPDKLKEKKKHPNNLEDLKIIEGIGPKIEQILKNADIQNWEDLADAAPKYLENILAEAGDRFRMHDPGTWPTQARLAARGEWNLLKEYQEDLKGGREVKE